MPGTGVAQRVFNGTGRLVGNDEMSVVGMFLSHRMIHSERVNNAVFKVGGKGGFEERKRREGERERERERESKDEKE